MWRSCAGLTVHLLALSRHLWPDEGGFAMVARYWDTGGRYLYGPQWVDRPPGLLLVFDAADHLGPFGVRLTATAVGVALVAAVAWAADAAGGPTAARWAAWAGFAFASSVLSAQALNGELAAALFVSLSVGAVLRAVPAAPGRAQTWAMGSVAGACASAAVLVKQNFVDGFAFAAVVLLVGTVASTNGRRYRPSTVAAAASAYVLGAAAPVAATAGWAITQHRGGQLLYAMSGFRTDADRVMARLHRGLRRRLAPIPAGSACGAEGW
jgi:hypothetical protein